jgi:hypothetical protein
VVNAIDDTASKPPGVPTSTDVSVNDAFPSGATFTAIGGTCANISPATPTTNTTGVLNYTLPASTASCTVDYKLCAPAPYNTVCDTATLTVSSSGPKLATLTVRQAVLSPLPVNLKPPFSQTYTGDNGWTIQTVTNNDPDVANLSPTETLAANNTATTLSTRLPDARWFVNRFSCMDTSAATSGNPRGTLVSTTLSDITIPADKVLAGATLVCTLLLAHVVP